MKTHPVIYILGWVLKPLSNARQFSSAFWNTGLRGIKHGVTFDHLRRSSPWQKENFLMYSSKRSKTCGSTVDEKISLLFLVKTQNEIIWTRTRYRCLWNILFLNKYIVRRYILFRHLSVLRNIIIHFIRKKCDLRWHIHFTLSILILITVWMLFSSHLIDSRD